MRGVVGPNTLRVPSRRPPFPALSEEQAHREAIIKLIPAALAASPPKRGKTSGDRFDPKMRHRIRSMTGGRSFDQLRLHPHHWRGNTSDRRSIGRAAPRPTARGWLAGHHTPHLQHMWGHQRADPIEWGGQNRSSAMKNRSTHDKHGGPRPLAGTRLRMCQRWM